MLPRGIKFAYAVMLISAAAIAFISLRSYDEIATPGAAYTMYVGKADTGAGATRVTAALEAFARSHGVNIGRLYGDPLNGGERRIYLQVGDPGATSTRWLAEGYPYFSREAHLELRPYSEISAIEPDGTYLVYGSLDQARDVRNAFIDLGYQADLQPAISISQAVRHFGHGALVSNFLTVGLLSVVTVACAVVLNAKSYGIQRLQGQSWISILGRDLRQIARFCAVTTAAVSAGAVMSLFVYNRLHQFGLYVRVALIVAAGYGLAALLAHGLTLALLHRGPIPEAIKGEVTATWAVVGSYVLRGWALLLLFSVGTSVVASGSAVRVQREKYRTVAGLGSAYYLRVNGAIEYLKNGKEMDDRIGQWIREADQRNEISVASRVDRPESGPDLLIVNDRYLQRHTIYTSDGARAQPVEGDEIRVLIPQQYSAESAVLTEDVSRWRQRVSAGKDGSAAPKMRTETTRNHQSLVTYSRSPEVRRATVEDPVVVVATGRSGVISNDEYVSMASSGGVLVENPDRAMRGLTAAGVGAYILGLSPFAQDAATEFRDAKREFSIRMANLVMAAAVLLVTALAVAVVYCRRNRQALFVKYLHGWPFGRTHWRVLVVEVALGLMLVLWAWNNAVAVSSLRDRPGAPPISPEQVVLMNWGPVFAGGIAVTSVGLIVVTLARTTRGFNRGNPAIHS